MLIASYARAALSTLTLASLAALGSGCQHDSRAPTPEPATSLTTTASTVPSPQADAAPPPSQDHPGSAFVPHEAVRQTETFGPDGGPRLPSEPVQEAPR